MSQCGATHEKMVSQSPVARLPPRGPKAPEFRVESRQTSGSLCVSTEPQDMHWNAARGRGIGMLQIGHVTRTLRVSPALWRLQPWTGLCPLDSDASTGLWRLG